MTRIRKQLASCPSCAIALSALSNCPSIMREHETLVAGPDVLVSAGDDVAVPDHRRDDVAR
jgi:hypothetical protein